ncbi:MAG TPA: SDR family oxidoreductase [Candidatus Thermoplasmatota archaeon]|nr:SDR family oxidoreductase [Candidatus Thermoplasmatota archaeon]
MPPGSIYRDDLFAGRVVLVTGGATGMGKAMALAFAAHGADVWIASRKEDNLRAAAEEIQMATGRRARWRVCDVREREQVDALVAAIDADSGRLDVLVNNAAGNFLVPFDQMSRNAWASVVGIALNGTFHVSQAAFPLLSRRGGSVLNMVATYAWGAAPYVSHSGAAKAGVLNLTRSLAVEWASHGIRVNALAPGAVPTKNASGNLGFSDEDAQARLLDTIPLRRLGTPEEMALAALWLCSPAASYVTGECLVVDGGQWLVNGMFRG